MTEEITWEEIRKRIDELRKYIEETGRKLEENQRLWREYIEGPEHQEFLKLHEELCGSRRSAPKVNE